MEDVLTQTKFDLLRTRLKGTELPLSEAAKQKAQSLLQHSDFPTRKNENWKYTNVNGLNKLLLDGSISNDFQPNIISNDSERLHILNGWISNQANVPGVKTSWDSLPELSTEEPFDALNLLYCTFVLKI